MNITHTNPLGLDIAQSFIDHVRQHTQEQVTRLEGVRSARIINIDGRTLRFESSATDFTILLNAAPPSARNTLDVSEQIIMGTVGVQSIMQGGNSAYTSIKDENGLDLAYYDKKYQDLYIPFDMTVLGDDAKHLYQRLIEHVVNVLDAEIAKQHTWGEGDTAILTARIKHMIEGRDADTVANKERKLRDAQHEENDYRDRLRRAIVSVARTMEELERARTGEGTLDKKIVHEFEHILKNPDVKRLEVRDNHFTVHTNRIIGISDQGKYYDFGTFAIKYTMGNSGVSYKGSMKRKGYWTQRDPHPHIDGDSGNPCLGNVGEAIAQLSSMHEYASLVAVAIEFLKAANTQDVAGKNVKNWDEVDMQGNVIATGIVNDDDDEDMGECQRCGDDVANEDLRTVYEEADEDDVWDNREVCEHCRDNHYTFHDGHEEYINEGAEVFN